MSHTYPVLLDTKTAARALSVSKSTLAHWRIHGHGPAYTRVGKRVVYLLADLNAFLQTNRVTNDTEVTK